MNRILVVGMSGAGKTTAARRIAALIDAPFHEMDTLAVGPGWSTPPTLVQDVEDIVRRPRWVFDSWGYEPVRDVMWARADTVVWLDYPALVVLPRLLRRSLSRTVRRIEVFGGNRETWRGWLHRDHPFWHAVTTFRQRHAYLAERSGATPHVRTIRLADPQCFEQWLVTIRPADL